MASSVAARSDCTNRVPRSIIVPSALRNSFAVEGQRAMRAIDERAVSAISSPVL
jgi:hypothetical protein